MRIGIIGAGAIGGTLASLAAEAGHSVVISNSRGPESLSDLVAGINGNARAASIGEAAAFGDVVIEAIPFGAIGALPMAELDGKILASASNYYPGRDGEIELGSRADTELVAEAVPGARVVKSFNTIWSEHLRDRARPDAPAEERRALFVAGDDADAKATVTALMEDIGFGVIDMGDLREGGRQLMPGSPVYNRDITLAEARRIAGL